MKLSNSNSLLHVVYTHRYSVLLCMFILLWCINMTIDVMELDAAQYAAISREMAATGSYVQVYFRGVDYLDKPPLLFWLTSQSILILGNTNIAAKLPAVILLLVSLWATYRLGRIWYDHRTGLIATIIVGSTQAYHLMTLDVRTDGVLTSFVIISALFLSLFLKHGKLLHLLLAGISIGGAMLAKGPIGLIIPAAAVGGHLLMKREWKKLFNLQWLLVIVPITLVLAPMCYGLYTQFDLHPEKKVNDLTGVSGLRFYFWTQSFGRITGESVWQNHSPWHYFVATMLWDFQPWVAFFIPAIFWKIKTGFRALVKKDTSVEWISLCGFIIPFIALSASQYKLPHYIFPLFPFAAIILASYVVDHAGRIAVWCKGLQWVVIHFLIGAAVASMVWAFPVKNPLLYVVIIGLYFLMWWLWKKTSDAIDRILLPTLIGAFILQLTLTVHFYPHLLRYQSSSQAGKYIEKEKPAYVYWHDRYGYALDYYSDRRIPVVFGGQLDSLTTGSWLYVSQDALGYIPPHRIIRTFDDFSVANLNGTFINPLTRHEKLKKMYLVEITGSK